MKNKKLKERVHLSKLIPNLIVESIDKERRNSQIYMSVRKIYI